MRRVQPDICPLLQLGNVSCQGGAVQLYLLNAYPMLPREPVKPVPAVKPAQVLEVGAGKRCKVFERHLTLVILDIMGMRVKSVYTVGDFFCGNPPDVTCHLTHPFYDLLISHVTPTLCQQAKRHP